MVREGEVFGLQLRLDDHWETMYQFTLAAQTRVDFEAANWFTSTHPRSLFTRNLIVCRVMGETRVNLVNSNLSVRCPDGHIEKRTIADPPELEKMLENVTNLALPTSA